MTKFIVLALPVFALAATGCRGSSDSKATANAGDAGGVPGASSAEAELGPNEPANATSLPADVVRTAVNPNNLPIYAGPTASLEGTVTVVGDPPIPARNRDFSQCPDAEGFYGKSFREGPARPDGSRPLADALVVLTGYAGYIVAERHPKKRMTIERCAYSTRTIDLTFGQVLQVQNHDSKMHAPEISDHAMPALMVASPGGDPVEVYPTKPGFTLLTDKMGPPWMTADVYTLPQPLHAVTDRDGHFRVDGIPTENADHSPVDDLEISAALRAIGRSATKRVPHLTPNVVEHVDVQLENHPPPAPPDAGVKPVDAGKPPPPPPPKLH